MSDLAIKKEQCEKDIEKLNEELQSIKKQIEDSQLAIPKHVFVGQIYERQDKQLYMVASFGGDKSLTCVKSYAGCYSSDVLVGTLSNDKLRQLLIDKKMMYVGNFNEVFVRKNNE